MKHTAGEWKARKQEDNARWMIDAPLGDIAYDILARDAALIALAPTAPHDCDVPGCPGAANKKLLEAAGELLDGIRALLLAWDESAHGRNGAWLGAIKQAKAALAKAQAAKVEK